MSFKSFCLALAVAAAGISLPAAADQKIAVVHFGDLMQASPQAKVAGQKMQAEFQKRQQDLETAEKQFQTDAQNYQRDGSTLPREQADKQARDLTQRQSDLKFQEDKLQRDFESRKQELSKNVYESVVAAITLVARSKGFDVVLPDYIYASTGIDISDDVLKQLASASPPAASGK